VLCEGKWNAGGGGCKGDMSGRNLEGKKDLLASSRQPYGAPTVVSRPPDPSARLMGITCVNEWIMEGCSLVAAMHHWILRMIFKCLRLNSRNV